MLTKILYNYVKHLGNTFFMDETLKSAAFLSYIRHEFLSMHHGPFKLISNGDRLKLCSAPPHTGNELLPSSEDSKDDILQSASGIEGGRLHPSCSEVHDGTGEVKMVVTPTASSEVFRGNAFNGKKLEQADTRLRAGKHILSGMYHFESF